MPRGEINVNLSIFSQLVCSHQLIQCQKSPPQSLLFFLNRLHPLPFFLFITNPLKTNKKKPPSLFVTPCSRFVLHFQIPIITFYSQMGQESDSKAKLVLEICSISTRSAACVHRLVSNPPKATFIDWYCILGVSS